MSKPRIRIEKVLRDYAKMNPGTPWRSKCEEEAADEIQSIRQRVERLEGALRDIVDRSHNDPLGTSKVIDMRKIAIAALSPKVQEG